MEEDFFGYSDLDISAKSSKLSNLIQYLEDEITFLESEQGNFIRNNIFVGKIFD